MNICSPRFNGVGTVGRNVGHYFYIHHPEVRHKGEMDRYLNETIQKYADQFLPSTDVELEYSFPGSFASGDKEGDYFSLNLTFAAQNGKKYRTSLERPLPDKVDNVKDIKAVLETFLTGQVNRIKQLEEIVSDETDDEHFFLNERSF